jgi:hypothetical protein
MFGVTYYDTLVSTFRDRIQRIRNHHVTGETAVSTVLPLRRSLSAAQSRSACRSLRLIAPVRRNYGIQLSLLLSLLLFIVAFKHKRLCLLSAFYTSLLPFYTSLLPFCDLFESNKLFMLTFVSNVRDDSVGPK